ncbi:MAG: M20/M25/M40 family metallo-hydrolase [Phycisphaerales bacterium]
MGSLAQDSGTAFYSHPSPDRLRAFHDMVADTPHIAGFPGDRVVVDRLVAAFEGMGLEVERHSFWALLCEPVAAEVQIVAAPGMQAGEPADATARPTGDAGDAPARRGVVGLGAQTLPIDLPLREAIPGDPLVDDPALTTAWNAYSASGDVTAQVVYANYGTREDFARLAELGVDCTGKIVICRYGGNFRGFKARFAEQAGAAAVIIYTDPADSGYVRGDTWPRGGFQHECGVQRGSILTTPYEGDPLTPFAPATRDAERLSIEEADLPRIPVQPMGWIAAREILGRMEGRSREDQSWQGGLAFTYRLEGGADLLVRVHVEQVREVRESWNVVATLEGEHEPDEWVLVGCHHDAWGYGASDPTAGLICLLEAARLFGEAAAAGNRPYRTIKFCCWGAEEFGIIGSTEWAEANAAELDEKGVAYINLDMAAMGPDFRAAASPSLRHVVWEAAGRVEQCDREGVTVLEDWRERSGGNLVAAGMHAGGMPETESMPSIGSLGGGSDHVAFLCHLGIPSIALSAGGSPGTAYHTNHDHLAWYRQVVGEDYGPAAMVTGVTCWVIRWLDGRGMSALSPLATALEAFDDLESLLERATREGLVDHEFAEEASERARAATSHLQDPMDAVWVHLIGVQPSDLETHILESRRLSSRARAANRDAERAWLDPDGLPDRPWFRNLFAATDEFSGYAAWVLPGVEAALDREDPAMFRREVVRVLERMEAVAAILRQVQ